MGLAKPRGEGAEGPVARPTLTGTLETCVLGGRVSPLAQTELEGHLGDRETCYLPPPYQGGPLSLGDPSHLHIPGTNSRNQPAFPSEWGTGPRSPLRSTERSGTRGARPGLPSSVPCPRGS